MPNIVATILSGNSASHVGEAIQSVLGWVDRVLLIDTGITDSTRDVARQLLGERLIVEPFPWKQDFAAARNFALDAAARHGATWALTLDTDERLQFSGIESLGALKARFEASPRIRTWLVSFRDGSYSKERFIRVSARKDGGAPAAADPRGSRQGAMRHSSTPSWPLAWKGRVHEFLDGAASLERAVLAGVTVWELRKTPEQLQAKLQRDLTVLLEETDIHPENARWWYYLGQTYEMLGVDREALAAFRRCAAIRQEWAEQAAWACYRAANCCLRLQELDEALEWCAAGLARQPESPELAWFAGFVCYQAGKFQQAVTWSQLAIAIGHFAGSLAGQRRISFRHLPGWYEGPYDVLRYAYRQLGQPERAEECERNFVAAKALRESRWRGSSDPPALVPRSRDCSKESGLPDNAERPNDSARAWLPLPTTHQAPVRVAVLGLYSSGSTATAALLSKLGVRLGRRFFANYYEPQWLAAQLRKWWQEPLLEETTLRGDRVQTLRAWINDLEHDGNSWSGAKHPLLTLCGPDLAEAWGPATKFIWTWRPLEESISSLRRRAWWPGQEEVIQSRLWRAAEQFFTTQAHLRVEFDQLLRDPRREMDRLIGFLGLQPTDEQRAAAAAAIQRGTTASRGRRVLFDLGTHYGEGLRQLSPILPLDATWEIHAFEPNPNCDAQECLTDLGIPIAFHRAAVWTHDGVVAFCPQDRRRCATESPTNGNSELDGWGSRVAEINSRTPGLVDPILVPCVDLSRLLAERAADDEIVIKMDVEGAEFAILRRLLAQGTMRRVRRLYVEWHVRLVESETEATRAALERQIRDLGVELIRWK